MVFEAVVWSLIRYKKLPLAEDAIFLTSSSGSCCVMMSLGFLRIDLGFC
jgi:hypothetical protein